MSSEAIADNLGNIGRPKILDALQAGVFPQVDRRSRLSLREFRRDYLYPGRPLILTDAIDDWKHNDVWSWDYLKKNCGHIDVRVFRLGGSGKYRPEDTQNMRLGELVEKITELDWGSFPYYMRDEWRIFQEHPSLMSAHRVPDYFFDWFKLLPRFMRLQYPRLFVGPRGAVSPLHVDIWGTHAWLSELLGRKRWILFPPTQSERLYNCQVRIETPDLQRFPRYRDAEPLEATIGPGETIFVPSRWAHWVHSLAPSLSVTYNYMGPGCFWSCTSSAVKRALWDRFKSD